MTTTYTKLWADGAARGQTATGHQAVCVSHELLARPIIVTAHRSPKRLTWADAKKWAEGLTINGWSWRLPTVEEAFFTPDRSKYPAYDTNFFPDCEGEWIWTSTVDAENPETTDDTSGYAWGVDLDDGSSSRGSQGSGYFFVRAVRNALSY